MKSLRRHRIAASALAVAVASLVAVATPAHAELESVYVLPGPVCSTTSSYCEAGTEVYIMTPEDYAACSAELASGTYNRTGCDSQAYEGDARVGASLAWNRGGCAQLIWTGRGIGGFPPVWSYGSSSDTSAPATCSTIDMSFTQTLNVPRCPGTSFQVTADVKGNADGTFNGSYQVIGSGPCASAFDVIAVEGPGV